ncbi:S1 domain-containing RNA-binding protein [Ferviditalea candida]|uniref:S1 domain-containing RNA-binding protein n=1 Tax=Ferviditalea candida TaxID=3108399 RepID=A0ABU5ZL84_9BACL|nr:S1 domain-containing RNA-binding protein [Paenibacillaceae bacterium T2]
MSIQVGTKLEGKVTGITHFGAFVELPGGVTGLVHISEIADNYVKDVKDHLKIDDVVTVKVINVDKDGKIGLSIKQAVDKPKTEKPARPERQGSFGSRPERQGGFGGRPESNGSRGSHHRSGDRNQDWGHRSPGRSPSFEEKMVRFLRDSEERISSLKKNTDSKRGGRGAKRV